MKTSVNRSEAGVYCKIAKRSAILSNRLSVIKAASFKMARIAMNCVDDVTSRVIANSGYKSGAGSSNVGGCSR